MVLLWIDSAIGVWKNLQTRLFHRDIFRISDIRKDLYKFRQCILDVSNYFTHIKVMWDGLENYRPLLAGSYVIPCSCGVIVFVQRYREQYYVNHFLKGFNEKFTHSKSHIMMMNPFTTINYTFGNTILL